MKLKYILSTVCYALFLFTGCTDDERRVVYPYSSPEISNISYSMTNEANASDSIYFSLDIKDPQTPLSTLEIALVFGDKELYSGSIRTAGYTARIEDHGIYIPFYAGLEEGEATLSITAINVEGSEKKEVKTFTIKRPQLPETIYLHYEDNVVPMKRSDENPYEYVTESGNYPETFSGKISTNTSLEDSELIWGYFETKNEVEIGSITGAEFSFDYTDWQIEKIKFNAFVFGLTIEGISKDLKLNGVSLSPVDSYYYASIQFERGKEVEAAGFENLEGAYNRDFFEYDATTGKLTFLRESGKWQVYYSFKHNYMWIARMDDIAPAAYWLVGHGFTSALVWSDDYNSGGWDLEDISRMAYAIKIDDNKYQATIYLNDTHEWDSFEVEIYSDREWGKDNGMLLQANSFLGNITGFHVSNSNGFTNTSDFVPGYFRLTFDTSAGVGSEKMHIERIGY